MVWQIEFDDAAKKDLARLDKNTARRITTFLRERVASLESPRSVGDALKGPRLGEFWRYRMGDYRILARIEDERLVVLVVRIGHRKDVYRGNG